MSDLLKNLTTEQLDELADAIAMRRASRTLGKKVDYDAMTPSQLADVNKTIHPITHYTHFEKYPCVLYGLRDGKPVTITVNDEDHELVIREKYNFNWKYSLLDHGIETAPSHGDGIKPVEFTPVNVGLQNAMEPAAFAQGAIEAQRRSKVKAA
jgi:hypothetical protein